MYLNIEIYTIPISLAHAWLCERFSRLIKRHREASCCSLSVFLDLDTTASLLSALATSVSLTPNFAQWPLAVLQQKIPLGPKKHFTIDHHYTYIHGKKDRAVWSPNSIPCLFFVSSSKQETHLRSSVV